MAITIPEKPRQFDPASLEGSMFDALAQLSDDYYVFHSFRITDVANNVFHESETDFVIYNQNLGILCLEAKAGQVHYSRGEWLYGNGTPMHNDGPFNQASSNKHKLRKYISNSSLAGIINHCKFLHAVWFPSLTDEQVSAMKLPSEADKRLIMTKGALIDPEKYLSTIFSTDIYTKGSAISTNLSEAESKRLIREILCPEFKVFPSASFESDLKKIVFHRLLKEQANILFFLDDQRTAAINGAAGTGKTMIACEKAHRHAKDGDKVLFLCVNYQLKVFLDTAYPHTNISYYTIAGFVCKLCNTATPDYAKASSILEDMYISGSFPYKHIIIDEGQDFGTEIIEEADIIQLIHDIAVDHEEHGGTFYVFYDKLQLIQAMAMPKFIENIDCRLSLYRNCRNTENIATTSLKPITERKPKLFEGSVKGVPAKIHFCDSESDEIRKIDSTINALIADGLKEIVILTCRTERNSILTNNVKNGLYRQKYRFTTCRKFKGLESDAVILIDIDKDTFREANEHTYREPNVLVYYVGASRAKLRLEVFTTMSDEDCHDILEKKLHYSGKIRNPKKDFASALNTIGSQKD